MSREQKLARQLARARRQIRALRALVRPDYDPPCECRFAGDTFDPRGCPAHDREVKQPWA